MPTVPQVPSPSVSSSSGFFRVGSAARQRKMALSVFSLQANERAKEVGLSGTSAPEEEQQQHHHHHGRGRRSIEGSIFAGASDVASASQAFAKTLTDIEQLLAPSEKHVRTIRLDEPIEEKLALQGISHFRARLPNSPGKAIARLQTSSGVTPLLWASTSCRHPDAKDYDVKGKDSKLVFEHSLAEGGGVEATRRDLYLSVEAALGQCVYRLVLEFMSAKKPARPTQQNMLARIQELKTDLVKREEFDEHLLLLEEKKAMKKRQEQTVRKLSALLPPERNRCAFARYADVEPLKDALDGGQTVLVRARWIVEHAKTGKPLPRRQDLPKEAFVAPADELLQRVATDPAFASQPRLLAVSHCWLTPEHPDPEGRQLQTLAGALEPLLKELGGDMAVFFDWCSLHQRPRTEQAQEAFEQGMNSVDLWFGHRLFWKLLLTKLPPGSSVPSYGERGWPHFERCLGTSGAEGGTVLDLGLLPDGPANAQQIMHVCRVERQQQPIPPDDFAVALQSKHFANKTDCDFLVKKYREALQVLGGVP